MVPGLEMESPHGPGSQKIMQTAAAWVCLRVDLTAGLRMFCRILLMVCFCKAMHRC
jgi:hypothetical protein